MTNDNLYPDYAAISSSRILSHCVASLLLYKSIFDDAVGKTFLELLNTLYNSDNSWQTSTVASVNCLHAYSNWFRALAAINQSWQDYLINQILSDENPFSQQVQKQALTDLSPSLIAAAKYDLQTLENIYLCSTEQISHWVKTASQLSFTPISWSAPTQANTFLHQRENWADALAELATYYRQHGTGIYACYGAFRWQEKQLMGINHPDPVELDNLVGYESQKQTIQQNTEFLLSGYAALNVLLYGSRGSGKSSLVKGLLPKYQARGLRLIEVAKSQLQDLPLIVEQLRDSPQKFIIFVDDLSFEADNDAFKALKVVLEGTLTAKPQNVVVYATSNRRHLVPEFFDDRPSPSEQEEVHSWDTVEEKLSFSDRFGLTLTFTPPDQDSYLKMVRHLAQQAKIELAEEELEFRAKQWATRHNGRSGRTARQFVDFLQAELGAVK